MDPAQPSRPTVIEVLAFENLPLAAKGSRRAVVHWSDGSESEACRWYDDEILVCEGDLLGKTLEQITSLVFRRDCEYLTDPD